MATSTTTAINAHGSVFRTPAGYRYFSLLCFIILAAVSALFAAFAVLILAKHHWGLGILIGIVSVFMAALAGYVLKDLRGRWGLRVELLDDRMLLDLPSGRSLIHRPPTQHLTVAYDDVGAVESRLEAFRSLGMAMIQCPYVLKRKNGDRVFLFEDRALATGFSTPMYTLIANAICERAKVPLVKLGMIEGTGGVLAVWGTGTPDWAAPALPMKQQLRLWRHAAATGSFAGFAIIIAFMIEALFRL